LEAGFEDRAGVLAKDRLD